jgi:hypothetical protein
VKCAGDEFASVLTHPDRQRVLAMPGKDVKMPPGKNGIGKANLVDMYDLMIIERSENSHGQSKEAVAHRGVWITHIEDSKAVGIWKGHN